MKGHNLVLTGQAVTGKSYVIKKAVKQLRRRGVHVALTCSTGIGTLVFGNELSLTLHKWAGLEDGRHQDDELFYMISTDSRYSKVKEDILKTSYLFIDEVSMISSKT